MTIFTICFLVVYAGILIAYFFSETSGNFKRRFVNKVTLALMFLIFGLVHLITSGLIGTAFGIFLAIGLIFCAIGDVALLFSFMIGGVTFGVGNTSLFVAWILYLVNHGLTYSDFWPGTLIYVIMFSWVIILWKTGWIDFKKYGVNMALYLGTVMLHGTMSLCALSLLHDPRSIVMFLGSILFMFGDWLIATYKFKYHNNIVHRFESGCYFTGLMMIALSCSLPMVG